MAESVQFYLAKSVHFSLAVTKVQRYVLEKINSYLGTSEMISNNAQAVHIEHIMPKRLNEDWKNELNQFGDLYDEYIDRLGNLTLLSKKLNQSASNKAFKDKKQNYYTASEFKISKELLDYQEWNYEEIAERQKKLAKIAAKVWKI